jgi:hypothetical protein
MEQNLFEKLLSAPRGFAVPMTRVFGARDGANQTARDGEKWPLSWELQTNDKQLLSVEFGDQAEPISGQARLRRSTL